MPVPVTVLGGYLGAGKTTLVNRILAGAHGMRVVVVVNDFGEVNIDEELITSRSGDTIGLANGCLCCSLSDGMAAVVERILTLDPPPDHVLIEVSGVGDPGQVARWAEHPGLQRNAVLVCADAETVQAKASDRWVADTVAAQLHSADLLLLTKADVVSAEKLARTRTWLAGFAPEVPIAETRGLDVFALLSAPGQPAAATVPSAELHPHAHEAGAGHRSWVLRPDATVALGALLAGIAAAPAGVVRIKGIVRTVERPDRRTAVNAVGRHCTVTDAGPWTGADAESGLVVIATGELPAGAERDLLAALRSA